MIDLTRFAGKSIGVFGLGKAGEAAVAALSTGGAKIYAWDDKYGANPLIPNPHSLIPYTQWPWHILEALILAPGIPLTHPSPHPCVALAHQHHVPVIGDIELLYRAAPDARYVAITGTNGKSTTTTLIGHILVFAGKLIQVGGNLGTAALTLEMQGTEGGYILETSSYQLDLLESVRFNIAVLMNITPDHLDRHGDMQGYITAKKHMFERQQKTDVAIIAVDDDYTYAIAQELKAKGVQRVVEVSCKSFVSGGVYVQKGIMHDGPHQFDISAIEALRGQHNWQNAAAAYATARAYGIDAEIIYAAMKTFGGLRHRLQLVDTISGVRFINDSKATNADAASHALAAYEHIYWIAGGKAKEGGIESLKPLFPRVIHAYLIGDAAEKFAQTLGSDVLHIISGTLENAVKQASNDAIKEGKKNAVVLLSPACASFDQFKSFEHRGDVFCDLVSVIPAQAGISGRSGVNIERDSCLRGDDEASHAP